MPFDSLQNNSIIVYVCWGKYQPNFQNKNVVYGGIVEFETGLFWTDGVMSFNAVC